jgi:hypothetical protein
MKTYILLEYKRDITITKLGDKLVKAATRDRNQDIDTIISALEQMDPTTNKQYVEWLARQYITNQFRLEDRPRIHDVLTKFGQIKNKLTQRDINQYTLHSLEEVIDKEFNVEIPDDVDENTDVPGAKNLYNGPLGKLDVPMTVEAAKMLGSGTKWCTAANKDNMFNEYNEDGPLYVWRDKSGKKYQFHFHTEQFMDSRDKPIKPELLTSFRTSHPVISKLFKKYEQDCIKDKDTRRLLRYARDVLHDRWPEAEPIIATDLGVAYVYASEVIEDRWPAIEKYILKDPHNAYKYASEVIEDRWPEAEPIIMTNPREAYEYARDVIGDRWPEAESTIAKDTWIAILYAMHVIKGRWPAIEKKVLKKPTYAIKYVSEVIEDRWPEAEPIIMTDSNAAYQYARNVIKDRWPEAEPIIMSDYENAYFYKQFVNKKQVN